MTDTSRAVLLAGALGAPEGSRDAAQARHVPYTRQQPATDDSGIIDWNLDVIRKAEELGYDEVWVGSHLTSHYSPIACPLQVIARASGETCRIRLGTGVSVLYQNHPLTIAAQLAQLDHMVRGRLNFGFGAGATVSDKIGVDGATSHDMTMEALELILQAWSEAGPRSFSGKYWKVQSPVDAYSGGNSAGTIDPTRVTSRASPLPADSGRPRPCCGLPASAAISP